MDLDFLYNMNEGPLRSGLIVIGVSLIAIVAAIILHRLGTMLVRRLARGHPFTTTATEVAFNAGRACLILFMVRLVLTGAPDNTPGLTSVSYVTSVALVLALTWFLMRCVKSVSVTVIKLNPYNVADNLRARRILTQTRVLSRSAYFIIALLGLSFVLLTLPGARQFGASLLASAGVAGIVAGIAAKPVLGNFFAGLQIAFSQPIRIDDVLIVKGEWGRVEEITGTFVVVKIWDERRMIVPLQWFIENPFENWTHTSATILGTVFLWMDFSVPAQEIRAEFERVLRTLPLWDQRVCVMHVTDASERSMQIRLLVSAVDSGSAFDLRCQVREHMIGFIARNHPSALPRLRAEVEPRGNNADALDTIIDGSPRE
ncbi:mechanosensitive ion channel family protein [Herbaspirillum sp. alder98]|uniref:mechanosensitive ion channel family protein n=1 Tax=Herbaspirillum sp. alder98 TaxID=2913096 RepID=UPI001CD84473|nr:mechanosensitive ion channel domain-containing protein [Herbaspirillum sp. alder98]MCA1325845.1 mechanosensitive ion channel family protein [Herbaspirillum sp. alder98]